jgi:hypothetical protein
MAKLVSKEAAPTVVPTFRNAFYFGRQGGKTPTVLRKRCTTPESFPVSKGVLPTL